jgi:hypothetical protein
MERPSELFVITTILLLLFALFARFISPSDVGISIHWRANAFMFPPGSVCIALATALCFFAAIYSLWMLPFSRTATLLHFWLTSIGIALFWLSFYRAATNLPNSPTALWTFFVSTAVVLLAQVIFVWNVIQAIVKMPRLHS